MSVERTPPRSAEEARAQGYRPTGDLHGLRRGNPSDRALTAAPTVDCQTCPPGTLCFDYTYPDGGGHVVGYCDGNGNCQLHTKSDG